MAWKAVLPFKTKTSKTLILRVLRFEDVVPKPSFEFYRDP
jgi:hypothetical protein